MKEKINLFMKELKKISDFNRVKFVILFGSHANGKQNKFSDIDLAIYYDGDSRERFQFRKKMLSILSNKLDVQVFQDLPLFVRINVLKGKIIYAKNLSFVYEIAYETIKAFEDFKYAYYDYLNRRQTIC